MVFFFVEFVDLAEPVHVELPDERLNLPMAEVNGQHLVLKGLWIFNMDFGTVLAPTYNILELVFLNNSRNTSSIE